MERPSFFMSDEKIVSLFLKRNETAILETEKKYEGYLFKTARNILGDAEDSRECVNDALFLLWTHIPPDHPQCFKAYISRLVRNLAINRVKKQSRQKRVPSEFIASLDELSEYLEDPLNVEKEFDNKLLKVCLDSFLRSLNKEQKAIFVSRFYFFDSVSEIARMLGCSEQTVFTKLAKIKQQLKNKLRKEGFFYD